MNFILFGRSRSGTTITYKILLNCGVNIKNFSKKPNALFLDCSYKIGTPPLEVFNKLNRQKFGFIHIYRDGRDSVSSGIRMSKIWKGNYRPWKDENPRINSKDWANKIQIWENAKKFIPDSRRIDLRFEDYIDRPGFNATKLSEFLNFEIKEDLIISDKMHKGYYKDWVPDWQNTFHPDAIEALKLLGYI